MPATYRRPKAGRLELDNPARAADVLIASLPKLKAELDDLALED